MFQEDAVASFCMGNDRDVRLSASSKPDLLPRHPAPVETDFELGLVVGLWGLLTAMHVSGLRPRPLSLISRGSKLHKGTGVSRLPFYTNARKCSTVTWYQLTARRAGGCGPPLARRREKESWGPAGTPCQSHFTENPVRCHFFFFNAVATLVEMLKLLL